MNTVKREILAYNVCCAEKIDGTCDSPPFFAGVLIKVDAEHGFVVNIIQVKRSVWN